jgi:hypothetical protein
LDAGPSRGGDIPALCCKLYKGGGAYSAGEISAFISLVPP